MNMTVWIVTDGDGKILGVFGTRENAVRLIPNMRANPPEVKEYKPNKFLVSDDSGVDTFTLTEHPVQNPG